MTDGKSAILVASLIVISFVSGSASAPVATPQCYQQADLCISHLAVTVSAGDRIRIDAGIANQSTNAQIGKVWWVLAPMGFGEPWDRQIFQSRVSQQKYLSGKLYSAKWDTEVAFPSAFYDLALIVHRIDSHGLETHSDSRLVGPIYISSPSFLPWLVRRVEAPGPIDVVGVSGPQIDQGELDPLSRTVTLANEGRTRLDFAVTLQLRALLAGWGDRWWVGMAVYTATPSSGTLAPGQRLTIQVKGSASQAMLASLPIAYPWLVVSVGQTTADQVLLGSSDVFRTVASNSLTRLGLPSGPAALVAISTETSWPRAKALPVTITISNLTSDSQVIQVWWHLAPPGDQKPWTDAVASGKPSQLLLGPWATQSVVVPA